MEKYKAVIGNISTWAKRNKRQLTLGLAALVVVVGPIMALASQAHAAPLNIFSAGSTPANATASDSSAVELGLKFTSDTAGTVSGIRFYKGDATNGGTHIGHLWDAAGNLLASATFTNESTSGWQDVTFASPVSISPNLVYVASYYAPQGHYAYTSGGFNSAVDATPLHALANSTSPNGVFVYTSNATGAFPDSSYNATNYWVDIDFNSGAASTPSSNFQTIWPSTAVPAHTDSGDASAVSLGVKFQASANGYINGIRFYKGPNDTGTHVGSLWSVNGSLLGQATFTGETAGGWQDVQFNGSVPVVAGTTYIASYYAPNGHYPYDGASDPANLNTAVTNGPLTALAAGTSNGNGVYAYGTMPLMPTQTYNATNYWVDVDYSTAYTAPAPVAQPQPRAGVTGSGPLLVLTDPTNAFTGDYCSNIFKSEGMMACASTDSGNLTSSFSLSGYKTIVLADGAPLTSAQISLINSWVQNGGTFIAMKPDDGLDSLLGIGGRQQAALSDAYFQVNSSQFPGIETQTMQYHGAADQHSLSGASAMATLYSNAATATAYPAVTTRTVGKGKAVAFMFDVAKSVVYTREGNPGLTNQVTESTDSYTRLPDRFGLGWLDVSKAAIPQADELQRMLANVVESSAMPRLWYFPAYNNSLIKAAIVMTGDDHATNSQTLNRFAAEHAASPAGCSVTKWTCYTSSSYAFPNAFSDSAAQPYTTAGFEVSLHIADNGACASNWQTAAQLDALFTTAYQAWQASYPTISANASGLSERFHCYGVWHDYASIPVTEAKHGIKSDTNSQCWPNSFLNVAQCLFDGAGIPEQYTDSNGSLTGTYQFTTHATDENPATVTQAAINGLVTNATGSTGYYGYFTLLCHLDNLQISNDCANYGLTAAQTNNIPMVSGKQASDFWDGRNSSVISGITYATSKLTFSVNAKVANEQLMIPAGYNGKKLTGVTANGSSTQAPFQTINGVQYGIVTLAAGTSSMAANYK